METGEALTDVCTEPGLIRHQEPGQLWRKVITLYWCQSSDFLELGEGMSYASPGISRSNSLRISLTANPHQSHSMRPTSYSDSLSLVGQLQAMPFSQMLLSYSEALAGIDNKGIRVYPEVPLTSRGSLPVPPWPINFPNPPVYLNLSHCVSLPFNSLPLSVDLSQIFLCILFPLSSLGLSLFSSQTLYFRISLSFLTW